jgi:hypothetical protein
MQGPTPMDVHTIRFRVAALLLVHIAFLFLRTGRRRIIEFAKASLFIPIYAENEKIFSVDPNVDDRKERIFRYLQIILWLV